MAEYRQGELPLQQVHEWERAIVCHNKVVCRVSTDPTDRGLSPLPTFPVPRPLQIVASSCSLWAVTSHTPIALFHPLQLGLFEVFDHMLMGCYGKDGGEPPSPDLCHISRR